MEYNYDFGDPIQQQPGFDVQAYLQNTQNQPGMLQRGLKATGDPSNPYAFSLDQSIASSPFMKGASKFMGTGAKGAAGAEGAGAATGAASTAAASTGSALAGAGTVDSLASSSGLLALLGLL